MTQLYLFKVKGTINTDIVLAWGTYWSVTGILQNEYDHNSPLTNFPQRSLANKFTFQHHQLRPSHAKCAESDD